jgi:hypothetical protein
MKGLIDFAKLPLPQQARILWEQGNYLLSRQDGVMHLFVVFPGKLLCKVCTQETGTITQIIVVDSFIRRNASLQIDSLERSAA